MNDKLREWHADTKPGFMARVSFRDACREAGYALNEGCYQMTHGALLQHVKQKPDIAAAAFWGNVRDLYTSDYGALWRFKEAAEIIAAIFECEVVWAPGKLCFLCTKSGEQHEVRNASDAARVFTTK